MLHATLVIDRFHVVKALNEAVDEVRKERWRVRDTRGRKATKGLRWLLKDEFEHFWNYRYRASAEKFLK